MSTYRDSVGAICVPGHDVACSVSALLVGVNPGLSPTVRPGSFDVRLTRGSSAGSTNLP